MSSLDDRRADAALRTDAARRILARVASSAMLGVFLLLLARALPVDTFGRFVLAYTIGLVIGLVVGMGAPVQVMRVSADGGDATAARLYVLHTGAVSVVFAIAGVGAVVGGAPAILVAGGVFAYSDTLANFAQNLLAGTRKHTAASVLVVVHRAVPLLAWGGFALAGIGLGPSSLVAVFAVTAVIALLVPALAAGHAALRAGVRTLGTTLRRDTARYWALSVSGVLAQLQVSALALFAPPLVVGYFAMASRVTGPLTLLSAAVSTVAVPELASGADDPVRFARIYRRYRNLVIGYCVLVVAAAWPASWVVVQVIGAKYAPAQTMLIGMIVAAAISSVSQAISSRFIAAGRPGTVTTAIVLGGAATLALLALAGHQGRVGLVWLVPIVGQVVVLAVLLSEKPRGSSMPHLLRKHWERALLVTTVVALVIVAGAAFALQRDQQPPATRTAAVDAAADVRPAGADTAVKILVVGDSFTEGTTYGGRGSTNWTRIVQGNLTGERLNSCPVLLRVSGRGGAGYLTTGVRHTTFASETERLLTPDVSALMLVGSGNDLSHPTPQYRAAVDGTLRAVRKARPTLPIVVVGLSWIHDAPVSPAYRKANATLGAAAKRHGATFVDPIASGWYAAPRDHSIVGADHRHPTDEGHRIIAARMTPILADLSRRGTCE